MKIGLTIPNIELGTDPAAARDFAQAAEELGYDYLGCSDHVLGADLDARPNWKPFDGNPPPYGLDDAFHEPLLLLTYLAAFTTRIRLMTAILVLPQRQTVLLAKQAAELDVLSGGRLMLGVGIGWNTVEYEALGQDFGTRGARCAEQIGLLRRLWTERSVRFEGRFDAVDAAGLNPLPVQRPIPIWLGGTADALLRRIGAIGDGWCIPTFLSEAQVKEHLGRLRGYARGAGRYPGDIGLDVTIRLWGGRSPEQAAELASTWRRLGITQITFNTESGSYSKRLPSSHLGIAAAADTANWRSMDDRIDAMRRFISVARALDG